MGRAIIAGGSRATEPIKGIAASELAVGSAVKLKENGTDVEYLVVHQGLPSSLYDEICDGTWLIRKYVYEESVVWDTNNKSNYANSNLNTYLNSTFLGLFDADVQNIIKQIKIPYRRGNSGSSIASGSSGLSTKIFAISVLEIGYSKPHTNIPKDGAQLDYFTSNGCAATTKDGSDAVEYWTRSPHLNLNDYALSFDTELRADYTSTALGIRPALILPSDTLFDAKNLTLKGAA